MWFFRLQNTTLPSLEKAAAGASRKRRFIVMHLEEHGALTIPGARLCCSRCGRSTPSWRLVKHAQREIWRDRVSLDVAADSQLQAQIQDDRSLIINIKRYVCLVPCQWVWAHCAPDAPCSQRLLAATRQVHLPMSLTLGTVRTQLLRQLLQRNACIRTCLLCQLGVLVAPRRRTRWPSRQT